MSTSKPYHHGNLRQALLDAAGGIVENQGLDALSLREVARAAGVSHNAPYRHFANRDALLAALAASGFDELAAALSRGDHRSRGVAYVRFALANPERFRLMFGAAVNLGEHPALQAAAASTFDALQRTFAGAQSASRPTAVSSAAWSLVHGLAQLLLDGHLQRAAGNDPERFAREVLGAVRFGDDPQAGSPRT